MVRRDGVVGRACSGAGGNIVRFEVCRLGPIHGDRVFPAMMSSQKDLGIGGRTVSVQLTVVTPMPNKV